MQYLILPGTKLFSTEPATLIAVCCVRNTIKFIYFDLLPFMLFASFMKNQHYDFFPVIDTDHTTSLEVKMTSV